MIGDNNKRYRLYQIPLNITRDETNPFIIRFSGNRVFFQSDKNFTANVALFNSKMRANAITGAAQFVANANAKILGVEYTELQITNEVQDAVISVVAAQDSGIYIDTGNALTTTEPTLTAETAITSEDIRRYFNTREKQLAQNNLIPYYPILNGITTERRVIDDIIIFNNELNSSKKKSYRNIFPDGYANNIFNNPKIPTGTKGLFLRDGERAIVVNCKIAYNVEYYITNGDIYQFSSKAVITTANIFSTDTDDPTGTKTHYKAMQFKESFYQYENDQVTALYHRHNNIAECDNFIVENKTGADKYYFFDMVLSVIMHNATAPALLCSVIGFAPTLTMTALIEDI